MMWHLDLYIGHAKPEQQQHKLLSRRPYLEHGAEAFLALRTGRLRTSMVPEEQVRRYI